MGGEEIQPPQKAEGYVKNWNNIIFFFAPRATALGLGQQLKVWGGDMPVYLDSTTSGPSTCTPTHLNKTVKSLPLLSPFPTLLLLATMQRRGKYVDAVRVLVLLAICHSKRHFQLLHNCFYYGTVSVACNNFLRRINNICASVSVDLSRIVCFYWFEGNALMQISWTTW